MKSNGTSACSMECANMNYVAHGCDISIRGDKITVREGAEEITGNAGDEEWRINTYILGQIHGILMEYTPAMLIEYVKKSLDESQKH